MGAEFPNCSSKNGPHGLTHTVHSGKYCWAWKFNFCRTQSIAVGEACGLIHCSTITLSQCYVGVLIIHIDMIFKGEHNIRTSVHHKSICPFTTAVFHTTTPFHTLLLMFIRFYNSFNYYSTRIECSHVSIPLTVFILH